MFFLSTYLYLSNDAKPCCVAQHSVQPWHSSLKLTEDDLIRVQYYRIREGKEVKIAKAVLPP